VSKAIHRRAFNRRAGATPPSRLREPGSSYLISFPYKDSQLGEVEVETEASRTPARRLAERFLKGPIPLTPLAIAARLPGKALAVYLAIRYRRDLTREPAVTLPSRLLAAFEVDKDCKARALRALEGAGLITVERSDGRAARITLLDEPSVRSRRRRRG
jgi:hypothetical protein